MTAPHQDAPPRGSRPSGVRAAVAVPAAAVLAGALALAGPATAAGAASGTATVADSHPAWATAAADRGAAAPRGAITTTVFLQGQDPAGMAAYAAAVSSPADAAYRHYLTPAQYDARFGATPAQVSAVLGWLRAAGLTVSRPDEQTVTATGSLAATERAYGVQLHDYRVKSSTYYAPTAGARLPAGVAADVLAVQGLTDMPDVVTSAGLVGQGGTPSIPGVAGVKAPESRGADGATFLGPTPCSAYYGQLADTTDPAFDGSSSNPYPVCGYVPAQLRSAYGVAKSGLTGRGATVAVVDPYGSPTMPADANQYAQNQGDAPFRSGQFTESVTPAQWTNQAACGGAAHWAGEESLDVEAVHAMAPDAAVHYYGADSCADADLLAVFDTILDNRSADIVSDSWGGVIYSSTGGEDPAAIDEYTHDFEQGAIEGISFQFSSGDCGDEDPANGCEANDTNSTTPQPGFPAADPWATSVGGTSLAVGQDGRQLWDTAWGTHAWLESGGTWVAVGWVYGSGGGTSGYFARPWYQAGVVPTSLAETLLDGTTTTSPMRVAPDVSMDADPFTGFLFGMTQPLPDGSTGYAESSIGGTSLACPLFAGLQADLIQAHFGLPVGFANPALYLGAGGKAFTDVTATGPGSRAANILSLSALNGGPTVALTFGDDGPLATGPGYDDATGLGTASADYLSSAW